MTVPIVVAPDAELVAVSGLRSMLATRSEPYAVGVKVGTIRPPGSNDPFIQIRRVGGASNDVVINRPRIDARIWHDSGKERTDLGRLVHALLLAMHGTYEGVAVWGGTDFMGATPFPDPDAPDTELVMCTVELHMRGSEI